MSRTTGRENGFRAKRPGRIRYLLLGGLLSIYALFKKHRVIVRLPKDLKPPFIVVGNHSSFFDFIYAIRVFYPRRINFVVARKYFNFPLLGWVMRISRSIPKSLFQADVNAVVSMFDILKQGGIVGIYPEGQIAVHGITIDNGEAMAKFVRKAGVPVVAIRTGGGYFCNPPWAKNARKGPVDSQVELLITREEAQSLTIGEINARIRLGLYMDNYAWQRQTGAVYRGRNLAMGLENMLYRCPGCNREYTIRTEGDLIRCNCGLQVRFGEDGHFHWPQEHSFRHLGDWHFWQLEQEREAIRSIEDFSVSIPVGLFMLRQRGNGVERVGSGVFNASREAYVYEGTMREERVTLLFPAANIRYLPFDAGENFQIYHENKLYEFRPDNPGWCAKIANLCEGFQTLSCVQAEKTKVHS